MVEQVTGNDHVLNHLSIPAACFTHPEVSMVGLTEVKLPLFSPQLQNIFLHLIPSELSKNETNELIIKWLCWLLNRYICSGFIATNHCLSPRLLYEHNLSHFLTTVLLYF